MHWRYFQHNGFVRTIILDTLHPSRIRGTRNARHIFSLLTHFGHRLASFWTPVLHVLNCPSPGAPAFRFSLAQYILDTAVQNGFLGVPRLLDLWQPIPIPVTTERNPSEAGKPSQNPFWTSLTLILDTPFRDFR